MILSPPRSRSRSRGLPQRELPRRKALAFACVCASMLAVTTLAGCKDKGKQSADEARTNVQSLTALADKDVGEIERGLPQGAARMTVHLAKEDPQKNAPAVRQALLRIRREVLDLGVAKSTFFVFTDDKGIAIRNDLEQDTMAGKDVVSAYPALKKLLAGDGYIATIGQFPGAPNPQGPDKEWVAGVPVKREDGSIAGLLVTGWTYRRFAYHLQESLKRELQDKLMQGPEKGKLPVVYVFVFDAQTAYGARGTPSVDEKALVDDGVFAKTAAGPATGVVTITDRPFGWAAARVPKLGDGVGIAVLRSEI